MLWGRGSCWATRSWRSIDVAAGGRVRIVEVGPRDGLQNEALLVPTATKVAFIEALADAGLTSIEVTAFVSPRAIPQLADAAEVAAGLRPRWGVSYSALVPNERGLERAVASGIREIAVFTAASETFNRHNINASIDESFRRFLPVLGRALPLGLRVRGYVSCCFGCPYEGEVAPSRVADVVARLRDAGCVEVSLGDTIGVAAPPEVPGVLDEVLARGVPTEMLALHFHDTRGTALANVVEGLRCGVRVFDSSAGGLGGCPYSPGATGNLATEDLVYLLDRMGLESGVSLEGVAAASSLLRDGTGRTPVSRVWRALRGRGGTTRSN
jgi:isopropylmalate/homocitrate/citramalate synthase